MQVVLPQNNPVPESSLYSATKGEIDTLTMALAKELGPRNIRVNTVAPGLVDTAALFRSSVQERVSARLAHTCHPRLGANSCARDAARHRARSGQPST
jgi:3-oxoacyl-[acyl-carrier protein] reductase